MLIRPPHLLATLAASILGLGSAGAAAAQGTPCVLEYRRADNMWADWGRADGNLGTETITLQPGQRKAFVSDWAYEKLHNDGTNFYGSHLRRAVNRGTGPLQVKLRGPGSMFSFVRQATSTVTYWIDRTGFEEYSPFLVHLVMGSTPTMQAGDAAAFRHDLAEVSCPQAT